MKKNTVKKPRANKPKINEDTILNDLPCYKYNARQIAFVLQKIGEGMLTDQRIADSFNALFYDDPRIEHKNKVEISKSMVYAYKTSPKYQDIINDYKAKKIDDLEELSKLTTLDVQVATITEIVNKAKDKNDHQSVLKGIELIAKLTGKLNVDGAKNTTNNFNLNMKREEVQQYLADIEQEVVDDVM